MIEIQNAALKFDAFSALDGVTLTVPEGSAYGLIGSNGAGKSTLLRLLSGVYKPSAGSVKIDGEEAYCTSSAKSKLFFVSDETAQFNSMTLKGMRDYYKRFYDNFSVELFDKLTGSVKLPHDKRLSGFSKGMKRQAAVICGVSCRTKYLFLDEVFDGLDPMMRKMIKGMIIDAMLDNKLTVVFSSHNLSEMDEFCDRAGLLHGGKMVFDKDIDSVKGEMTKISFATDVPVTMDAFKNIEVINLETEGSVTQLTAKGDKNRIIAAAKALSPKFLDEIPLSLEEIFIYEMEVLGYDYSNLGR